MAKTALQDANNKKLVTDSTVNAAQNALDLTQQANDDALAAFETANDTLFKAENDLNTANQLVASIRASQEAAQTDYDNANWEWNQAINNLYVAQAQKEAADKGTAFA